MNNNMFTLNELSVKPSNIYLYIPPIVWKGDSVGHMGQQDLFFWVLDGECFLRIDSKSYIIKPGQLAFLPKGKMRAYTHASDKFTMYEMSFEVSSGGKNLMDVLGLRDDNFVVNVPDPEEMSKLFESSHRKELYKRPLHDVEWCANLMKIIHIYANERQKQESAIGTDFKEVLIYMQENLDKHITIEDLSRIAYMQPTYFIKRFREVMGLPPLSYFNKMKIYKAMGLLSGTDLSIEAISKEIGITDTSYFSRMFKKYSNVTPREYRTEFTKCLK